MGRVKFSADEKRVVGARQGWRCSACSCILPSAYEVDHTVPLHAGGADALRNCTAMCANCHAAKSQRERIAALGPKPVARGTKAAAYHAREDSFSGGVATCALCKQTRPDACEVHVCTAIEAPGARARELRESLARFAYTPRVH